MFLDLDNFKPLNDEHGHNVGDLLLQEVALRIVRCVRAVDTVARFGGDEFVVLLSELGADKAESSVQANLIAEKVRTTLAAPYVLNVRNGSNGEALVQHQSTSSIGLVLFNNQKDSAGDIVKWADIAMYQAKTGGRNRVQFIDTSA